MDESVKKIIADICAKPAKELIPDEKDIVRRFKYPVRESIRQVDENTWLVGPLMLRRSSGHPDTATWYDDGDDVSYTITEAPFKLVYDGGDAHDVWSLGNSAFLKVLLTEKNTTSEAVTLAYVHDKKPDFKLPTVLYNKETDDRSYLFLSRVPGRTLMAAWPTLDRQWKSHYVNTIASICKSLAVWEGDKISGVDGKSVHEYYLTKTGEPYDFDPEILQKNSENSGMDCSTFCFYHADLGPGNIMVENVPKDGTVGIIDWEGAGVFPKGWIRTKFRVSSGLNLQDPGGDDAGWWRGEVQRALEKLGFEEHVDGWWSWCQSPAD
ncbi:hypothetical protein BDW62DRAFT_202395 [Aspergillus aurantiobrunneus]